MQLTLNYGVHQPGMEFKQHVHARSEDVIVCLKGSGVIRSGDTRILFQAGDGPLVMFSCQAPPDAALYAQSATPG